VETEVNMAAATDLRERKAGPAAAAAILAGRRIPADEATPAGNGTPVDAATPAGKRIPVDAATLAGNGIPADEATPAGKRFPADAATPAVVATPVDAATTVGAMIEDEAGGIEADAALASGTTRHLTRTAPATTISPTIAIPTAITISGATGILQPLAATPIRTKDIN
jgi:hypothetical protein